MDKGIPYIDEIIPIIVSLASPEQIILFGSYARGDNTDKSDIDLLILKKGLERGRDIIGSIYMAFSLNQKPRHESPLRSEFLGMLFW